MMRVAINYSRTSGFAEEINYVLCVFGNNKQVNFIQSDSGIEIGTSTSSQIHLSEKFISNYTLKKYNIEDNLNEKGFVELADGQPDYISTAFYLLASLQEYDSTKPLDDLGRFQYKNSYQSKHNLVDQNIVQLCFDKLGEKLNVPAHPTPTRFFLSHDIDTVYESVIQDGFYAIKKGRFDIFLKLLFNVAIGRPDWLNMDQIMKLESEYDCLSTFFWIVKKGKEGYLKNADYDFNSVPIQKIVKRTSRNGFENGIHKSVSQIPFQQELNSFQPRPIANRYHYLKFGLPSGFDAIENSGLRIDASLGFADKIGFRNAYGLPYHPYDLKKRKPYSFIEVPLHVMDTTLFKYNKSNVNEAEKTILDFFEANRADAVLSVLWHNNFFSNYKYNGYLPMYKKILSYIRDNNFKTISQQEILDRYSFKAKPNPS